MRDTGTTESAPPPPIDKSAPPPGSVTFYAKHVRRLKRLRRNMEALSHQMAMTRTRDGVKPQILESWKNSVQTYAKELGLILDL